MPWGGPSAPDGPPEKKREKSQFESGLNQRDRAKSAAPPIKSSVKTTKFLWSGLSPISRDPQRARRRRHAWLATRAALEPVRRCALARRRARARPGSRRRATRTTQRTRPSHTRSTSQRTQPRRQSAWRRPQSRSANDSTPKRERLKAVMQATPPPVGPNCAALHFLP